MVSKKKKEVAPAAEIPGKRIADLALGDIFTLSGKRYFYVGSLNGDACVIELKRIQVQASPDEYKDQDICIARLVLPDDTEVEE